jgi:hypothetical protein
MGYVIRDSAGKIVAVSQTEMLSPGWENIDESAREYLDFLEAAIGAQDPFRESDIQLARVLEDLISLLIERDLIRFTDFPDLAQKRLIERQTLRMKGKRLDLIDDEMTLF